MTRQLLRPMLVDITGCHKCGHYYDAGWWELCLSPHSKYVKDGGKEDHHTIQHMRREGNPCGPEKRLSWTTFVADAQKPG